MIYRIKMTIIIRTIHTLIRIAMWASGTADSLTEYGYALVRKKEGKADEREG